MEKQNKSQLLDQFSHYLDAIEEESETEETDLYSLLTEMAALRSEVKTEARQFKTALGDFKSAFDTLQQANEVLTKELTFSRLQLEKQQKEITRSFLLEIIETYDRLAAGTKMLKSYKPVVSLFKSTNKQDKMFIYSIQEGQAMSLRRLEQLLEKHQVMPIEVLNQPLDPHCMTVIEIDHQSKLAEGIVTEELRKGFRWQDDILRLAEIKVNKKESK